ncbi:MAG: hypothetical protein WC082_12745 [Victivallales bacterium]
MNIYRLLRHVNAGKRDDFAGFTLRHKVTYSGDIDSVNGAVSENFAAFFPWIYSGSASTLSIYRINWQFLVLEHIQDLSFQTIGYQTPRVSISGNILAVGHPADGKVYLYEYDSDAGEFVATATLENSDDDKFGSGAMLYGGELAVGCTSGSSSIPGAFRIFERADASTWNQVYSKTESEHFNYGKKINFHNGMAVCGVDNYGESSDIFQKIDGVWTFIERSDFTAGIGGGSGDTLIRPTRSSETSPVTGSTYVILQVQKRENDAWTDSQEFHLYNTYGNSAGLFPLVRFGEDGSMVYTSKGAYAYFTLADGQYQLIQEATYDEIGVESLGESLLDYYASADGTQAAIFMGQYTDPPKSYVFFK